MRAILIALAFFGSMSASVTIASQPANDLQLFHRCYSFLTGTRVNPTHHALQMVTTGQWTPTQACMWVFDRATLITSGPNAGRTLGESSPEYSTDAEDALNILRNFQAFHRRWFSTDSLTSGIGYSYPQVRIVEDMISPYEAANHLSRILFTPNIPYRDFVTGVRSVIEVRENANPLFTQSAGQPFAGQLVTYLTQLPLAQFFDNWRVIPDPAAPSNSMINGVSLLVNPPLLQLGRLKGFRTLTDAEMDQTATMAFTSNAVVNGADPLGANYTNLYETGNYFDRVEAKFRKPFGGGAIGTSSYLILNMDAAWRNNGFPRADGGVRVWRRASRAIFHDFMCRTLPTLSAEDVEAFVRPDGVLPWQANASCMGCHAATDGMAGTMRNFAINGDRNMKNPPAGFTPIPNDAAHWATVVEHPTAYVDVANKLRRMKRDGVAVTYASQESDLYGINSDNMFFRRPPRGKVLMRDYTGRLISDDVVGIEALGQKIKDIDDFYACAASRYFSFFTGFEASLPDVPNASTGQIRAREFVLNLGQQLKQSQNLRDLIQNIITSDFFREGVE